jgi:hypothetical protein
VKLGRLFVIPLLVTVGCIGSASAQVVPEQQATRDDILKMLDVMHTNKQMEQVMQMMTVQMQQQIRETLKKQAPNLPPAAAAKLENSLPQVMTIYPISEMLNDMIPIYQRHLTKNDVNAIIVFYSSPAGEHLLDETPAMMKDAMATVFTKMSVRMQAYMAQLKTEIQASVPPQQTQN